MADLCRMYRQNLKFGAIFFFMLYASSAAAQVAFSINGLSVPVLGVPLTVLAMAAAGSLVGFAYTPPVESRSRLYTLALANTMLATWFVVLIPEWRGWVVSPVAQPPLAGVMAAANCVVVPMLFKRLPQLVTRFLDKHLGGPTANGDGQ